MGTYITEKEIDGLCSIEILLKKALLDGDVWLTNGEYRLFAKDSDGGEYVIAKRVASTSNYKTKFEFSDLMIALSKYSELITEVE